MDRKLFILLSIIGCLVLIATIVPRLSGQPLQDEPELTVTVSPEAPTTYEQTTITIEVKNTEALTAGPEIADETRGIQRLILWSHPVSYWQETYALPQLFPKEGLRPGDQIIVRVTIKDRQGDEKTIRKNILFQP